MNIKTKYNLNQMVWFMKQDKVTEYLINRIKTETDNDNTKVYYHMSINNEWMKAEEIFENIGDLLKSLEINADVR